MAEVEEERGLGVGEDGDWGCVNADGGGWVGRVFQHANNSSLRVQERPEVPR